MKLKSSIALGVLLDGEGPNPMPTNGEARHAAPALSSKNGDASHRTSNDSSPGTHRIEELIKEVDDLPDAEARELLHECLQAVLAYYGEGLERILQLTKNAGAGGKEVLEALVQDKLVRSLLLIHNLHPLSMETRLRASLDKIRPYLQSHGGNVELISLKNDVARLRLQGTCQTCPSSSVTLELAVRQTIADACPDLIDFQVEGVAPAPNAGIPHGPNAPRWIIIEGFEKPEAGHMRMLEVDGVSVVVCGFKENLYAYRNLCAACEAALDSGTFADGMLKCPSGHCFDVRHAGICPDNPEIHLDPFPLLASGRILKIAVKHQPKQNQKTLEE